MNTTRPQTAGTVLQTRIDRALHGGYDASFAAATIANFALLPIDEALSNHEFSANRCAETMDDPAIHELTDPYLGPHGKTDGPYTMGQPGAHGYRTRYQVATRHGRRDAT